MNEKDGELISPAGLWLVKAAFRKADWGSGAEGNSAHN